MVKKLQKMAEKKATSSAGLLDNQLAQTVKDSAQQIWLAGLGAFAKAQGEGGKVFDTLIKEGMSLHRKTQAVAEEKLGDVAGRMTAMAGQVGSQANAQWDKLETIFEERTARALKKLGVPTAQDVAALSAQVAALAAAVAQLGGTTAVATSGPSAAPKAARKTARKTSRGDATAQAAAAPAPAPAAEDTPPKPARKTRRTAAAAAPAPAVATPAAAEPPAKATRRRKPAA